MGKVRKKPSTPRTPTGINKSQHSMNPERTEGSGGQNMRDKATIKRLQMYKGGKAKRDSKGKVVRPALFQSKLTPGTVARVEPNRKWFGNTRVISQNALQTFKDEMDKVKKDPYKVVMRQTKVPVTLLNETAKFKRVHILETESFENTFGPRKQRKRPNLNISDMDELLKSAKESVDKYKADDDRDIVKEETGVRDEPMQPIFKAGQSKRIWNELYKVVDSSDIVVQVLDARDPIGTRSRHIEEYLKKEKGYKQLFFVLNKCDLVPTWVTQKWVAILSESYPTLAFRASITNPFGKGAMINLLRQFSKLHADKRQISVGFIGYPNVGKSSIINALREKKVCKVAPIAGETKVWQYVTLMRRIYLIDCPGVVYPTGDTETEIVLKGVVRVENVHMPEQHIDEILTRAKKDYLEKLYKVKDWRDSEHFLEMIAFRSGKLLKGGNPDYSTVAKMVLNDWQRGKIPYFVKPPESERDTKLKEEKTKTINKLNVKQDYRKIDVEPTFSGDDVKQIEEIDPVKESDEEFSDENDDGDTEEIEREMAKKADSQIEDKDVEKFFEMLQAGVEKESSITKPEKATTEEPANEEKLIEIKKSIDEIEKSKKLNKKEKLSDNLKSVTKSSSGAWSVKSVPSKTPSSTLKIEKISFSAQKISKKNKNTTTKRKKSKEIDEEEEIPKKLSGREKRKLYNQQKVRKIGVHYYDEANVKNRSLKNAGRDNVNIINWAFRSQLVRKDNQHWPQYILPLKYLDQCKITYNIDIFIEGIEETLNDHPYVLKTIKNEYGLLVFCDRNEFAKSTFKEIDNGISRAINQNALFSFKESQGALNKIDNDKVLIEYSSPNIAKPFHAGHLRSTVLGNCISNLYEYLGHQVLRVNYLGDWGTQFGLLILGIELYRFDLNSSVNIMEDLYKIYVQINKDCEQDPHLKSLALEKAANLEQGNNYEVNIWKEIRERSLHEYNLSYSKLNIKFDLTEGESDYVKKSKDLSQTLIDKNLLIKNETSGLFNMELSTTNKDTSYATLLKSDGSSLYLTRDLAALLHRKQFHDFNRIHYVVENGQHGHFAKLKGCIEKLNLDWKDVVNNSNFHVKFGRVDKMSTRKGTAVFLQDIIDEATDKMKTVIRETKTTKIQDDLLNSVAEQLAISALVFQDLRQKRIRNYEFDWNRVLQFQGNTGVYLQYTHARLCSLERKFPELVDLPLPKYITGLDHPAADRLIQTFVNFEHAIYEAYNNLDPHYVASYLHSLCKATNAAYDQIKVINASSDDERHCQYYLFKSAKKVLSEGLKLIGLRAIERM
ncbi:DgyrCDS12763 [Dimorphilus gyrociliatus]|uniref:Nucleolar GTP-binding protein 2 n=1 Tax=Dimorphilus gyrociliatus TaxID=2664684 RepID=A0A7I8W7F0_9ANNE|nr:DgyrCDS12763 [Dimorphilus gyrociliatus]